MKRLYKILLLLFYSLIVLDACKNYSKTEPKGGRMDSLINNTATEADNKYIVGARLVAANDCITCHSIDRKMFGPSFIEIAAKYKNNEKLAEYLSNNVIKGSKGIYGNNAMTPHPNLKYNDIIEMLKYILSLKPRQ